jgi:acetylornithine aminotransferase
MGALSVTSNAKYQKPFVPLIPDVDVGKVDSMEDIERLVTGDTCAVIVEPLQGEGGVNSAFTWWLKALRKRCNEAGAVLIFDEIQVSAPRIEHSGSVGLCIGDTVWLISNRNSLGAFNSACRMSS